MLQRLIEQTLSRRLSGNASVFLALCLATAVACAPPGELTGNLAPPATGSLALVVLGAPAGSTPTVRVSNSAGWSQVLSASATIPSLKPGLYAIEAVGVTADGDAYLPDPAAQSVSVAASPAPAANAAVTYAITTGRLAVTISGLPGGAAAAVHVSGPGGYAHALTATETLVGLVPGAYTLTVSPVASEVHGYSASPQVSVTTVVASSTPAEALVAYGLSTGALEVTVAGLPSGSPGAVTVSGPGGFQASLGASTALSSLLPGDYTITASEVSAGGLPFDPSPASQVVSVPASLTPQSRAVQYSIGVGSLAVTVAGLPGGALAGVTVSGPNGYAALLTSSTTLPNLLPGSYALGASTVTVGGLDYGPSPAGQNVAVAAGGSASATVTYVPVTGALAISVSGLPGAAPANLLVSGPAGYSQAVNGSVTLNPLAPGLYTVAASSVVSGGITYNPAPANQAAQVFAGNTANASVAYTASGGGATLNLAITAVYLTQAVQRFDGTVPLVAGRNAYARVFVLANQANSAQPLVRLRLYSGSTLVQTYTIPAPAASVPLVANEGALSGSFNVLVPAALVQPGLKVLADVDPADAIAESAESDNQFPVSGTAGSVDVRTLPTFAIRFVPVLQQANGLTGNVTDANTEAFLAESKALLPIGPYSADVRAVYTTTAPALQSDNGNGSWGAVLSEILALKSADASTRYYYGVVKTGYGSGVVGMGYVGGAARTSIGWDVMSSAPHTMAHELGHNMGRPHAPCGGAGNPDPGYPHAGGVIGAYGLDLQTLVIKAPSAPDVMGYCTPSWVSDYNWNQMVAFRQGGPNNLMAGSTGSGLLVWGRITPAGLVLEPAFRVASNAAAAPAAGPHRLELLDAAGGVLRTVSFAAVEVPDLPGGAEQHFAFVVPLEPGIEAALARLRLRSGGQTAEQLAAGPGEPAPEVTRPGPDRVRVRWDAARFPMVLVRDAKTGEILSFARGGSAMLWSRGDELTLTFSDGVKSVTRSSRALR